MDSSSLPKAFLDNLKEYNLLPQNNEIERNTKNSQLEKCKKQFKELQKQADSGDPDVWYAIGRAYHIRGVVPAADRVASEAWFRRAAKKHHTDAMVSLAMLLRHPRRKDDWDESIALLKDAAEMGNSSAMVFLGFAYRDGQIVTTDKKSAVAWFIKAYEAGDQHSAVRVGTMYRCMLKIPKDAEHWLLLAAENGYRDSYFELAELYNDRSSELFDPLKAIHWYEKIIQSGGRLSPLSMFTLAEIYCHGSVPIDKAKTCEWLQRLLREAPHTSKYHRKGAELLNQMESSGF
jgi:TPR repeat protein